jgi:hypothetical protein
MMRAKGEFPRCNLLVVVQLVVLVEKQVVIASEGHSFVGCGFGLLTD